MDSSHFTYTFMICVNALLCWAVGGEGQRWMVCGEEIKGQTSRRINTAPTASTPLPGKVPSTNLDIEPSKDEKIAWDKTIIYYAISFSFATFLLYRSVPSIRLTSIGTAFNWVKKSSVIWEHVSWTLRRKGSVEKISDIKPGMPWSWI